MSNADSEKQQREALRSVAQKLDGVIARMQKIEALIAELGQALKAHGFDVRYDA